MLLAVITVRLAVRRAPHAGGVLPALLLIALVAMATAPLLVFRLDLGVAEAASSRYVTFGSLAAVGMYFCLLALKGRSRAATYGLVVMAVLFALSVVDGYRSGLQDGRDNREYEMKCAAVVRDFRHRTLDEIACADPNPQGILGVLEYLERRRVSVFRQD